MSRIARPISSTGYYHVINRGTGKQILFEERADFLYFIKLMKRNAEKEMVTVIAYCLMDNHIHLLLHADTGMDKFMQQISISYAMHYNKKYGRNGHLFQNRYKSEAIESERYLLTVVRYIHNNPEKAGICRREDYPWSSWHEYSNRADLVSTDVVLSLTGGYQRFLQFSKSLDHEEKDCLDINEDWKMTDQRALTIVRAELSIYDCNDIQELNRPDQYVVLKKLKQKGLSIRQIERVTGIGRKTISQA